MNVKAVVFGFFVLLAATLNFGFVIGDIDNPSLHNVYELFAAVLVNLIATALKFRDRTHLGAMHLATSLVADLQLITAALVWVYAHISADGYTPAAVTIMVSCPAARFSPTWSRFSCSWSRPFRSATAGRSGACGHASCTLAEASITDGYRKSEKVVRASSWSGHAHMAVAGQWPGGSTAAWWPSASKHPVFSARW